MGKTRETANITAENLVSTNITSDFLNVGTAITMYGGSVGVVSATSFYGDVTGDVTATSVSVAGHITLNNTGANISGVCTATSFVGDGSNLTGISGGVTTGKAIAMAIVFG